MPENAKRALSYRLILCFVFLLLIFFHSQSHASSFVECAVRALQGEKAQVVPAPSSTEVAFSPGGGATDLIIKAISSAKKSIRVAAYSFTSRPIAKALVSAHQAGIDINVVVDHGQIEKESHSVIASLAAEKIPVRADIIHTLQHDKYMVIDDKTVQTGSFNYSAAAEHNNSENVIVLWESPLLAAVYADNWKSLWDKAEPYYGPQ
jgi:phosphatidylserine/phosphatidylglycerophosphate/cardiolipin synthase-like enzyme